MAKKSKSKLAVEKKRRKASAQREERRFLAQAGGNPRIVQAIGALSALLLGAGTWGYVYAKTLADDEAMKPIPAYLIAGGAVLLGLTIWIGTGGEPPVRVGDPGIAMEKGELKRMPWYNVQKISFDGGAVALVIEGKDEANAEWGFKIPLRAHPEGTGWIIKEALERIPRRVDITDETLAQLPAAGEHAGTRINLDPLQVVGKRCAVSGKTISYEPDARVCQRCERVYFKNKVPKKCKCGASLEHLRPKDLVDDEDEDSTESDSESALETADRDSDAPSGSVQAGKKVEEEAES